MKVDPVPIKHIIKLDTNTLLKIWSYWYWRPKYPPTIQQPPMNKEIGYPKRSMTNPTGGPTNEEPTEPTITIAEASDVEYPNCKAN